MGPGVPREARLVCVGTNEFAQTLPIYCEGLAIFRRSPWVVGQLFAVTILYLFAAGLMGVAANLHWL
jgi:fructose-1,6-bisphosphatase/inositol monophosphatase family enzyme